MAVPAGNVLITSASQKAPMIRAMQVAAARIGALKVIAGDCDPQAPAQYVADDFWIMARLEDSSVEGMIEGCKARDIRVIFPTRDAELLWWASHRETFEARGICVAVSRPEAIGRCLDKLTFAQHCQTLDLPVIPAAEEIEDLVSPTNRFVVKDRTGAGSRGIGIDLDSSQARAHANTLTTPIFQPYVDGPEISIDGWCNKDGQCDGVILRRRDRVVHGESQITTTFRDAQIERMAMQVLGHLGLFGPVVMQAKIAEDSTIAIIEVNPRFGGASTASIAAGLDSFVWSLQTAFGHKVDSAHFAPAPKPIRQIRIPSDIILHDRDF